MRAIWAVLLGATVIGVGLAGWWLWGRQERTVLTVFHAGSLEVPFAQLEEVFERQNPSTDVRREAWGSRTAIRQVTELGKIGDVVASADYSIVLPMMEPGGYADWYIAFAGNRMAIAYRQGAPFATEVAGGTRPWYDVLSHEKVRYGHSDPDHDPNGYRSLMVIQLAQRYYYDQAAAWGNTPDARALDLYSDLIGHAGTPKPREVVRPKETDLIALLQAGEIDYMLTYWSLCAQHGLKCISLDEHIDLSNNSYAGFYQEASVEVAAEGGDTVRYYGQPILYGITIPKNARRPELGVKFVQLLLSDVGKKILEENGQTPLEQPLTNDRSRLPAELKELVPQEEGSP